MVVSPIIRKGFSLAAEDGDLGGIVGVDVLADLDVDDARARGLSLGPGDQLLRGDGARLVQGDGGGVGAAGAEGDEVGVAIVGGVQ